MTAPFLLPSNALAAADRLRPYQPRLRRSFAKPASVAASNAFRARATLGNFPGTLRTDLSRMTWHGRTGSHAFEVVQADAALTGPVVLVAKRYSADARAEIVAVEVFEPENAARLAAWIERAATARIELQVHRLAGTRAARAAVVADLTPTAPRACAFVSADTFDRRAIMAAAVASARVQRAETGAAWAACLSTALREVWEVARAARLAAAY